VPRVLAIDDGMAVPVTDVPHPRWCAGAPDCCWIHGVLTHYSESHVINGEVTLILAQPEGVGEPVAWLLSGGKHMQVAAGTVRALGHAVGQLMRAPRRVYR
jgi:hypothetical protein